MYLSPAMIKLNVAIIQQPIAIFIAAGDGLFLAVETACILAMRDAAMAYTSANDE